MTPPRPQCVDCLTEGITTVRAIHPASGPRSPRCATHVRARKKTQKARDHARRTEKNFEITAAEYAAIKEFQNGRCYICQRATGQRRALAVDHDHKHCPGRQGCRKCVRSLLCSPCNIGVLGHLRDDPAALRRAIQVIESHPAQSVLREMKAAEIE